jgi:hypothetical protein
LTACNGIESGLSPGTKVRKTLRNFDDLASFDSGTVLRRDGKEINVDLGLRLKTRCFAAYG